MKAQIIVLLTLLMIFPVMTNGDSEDVGEDRKNYNLMTVGSFHRNEIHVKNGELWHGLYVGKNGFEIKATRVKVERVEDPVIDESGAKTGKKVSVGTQSKPILLTRKIRGLRAGPVKTVFYGFHHLENKARMTLFLNESNPFEYNTITGPYYFKASELELEFEHANKKQKISNDHATMYLVWAGDLNRDGRLDFLLYSPGGNTTYMRLYVSTKNTKNGNLVKEAGYFRVMGC